MRNDPLHGFFLSITTLSLLPLLFSFVGTTADSLSLISIFVSLLQCFYEGFFCLNVNHSQKDSFLHYTIACIERECRWKWLNEWQRRPWNKSFIHKKKNHQWDEKIASEANEASYHYRSSARVTACDKL